MTLELYLNIIHIIFGFLSNNWLSALISISLFCYNLYYKMKKRNSFNMIIDDFRENLSSSNKVGLEYKIKFVVYVLISIYALCFAIMAHFDEEDDTFSSLKIFSS